MQGSFKYLSILALAGTLLSCSSSSKNSEANISTRDKEQIAKEAYVFGYPLVLMDMSKRVGTNVSRADAEYAPVNQFNHKTKFPDDTFNAVVSPNADTLYSSAWLDLSKGPVILTVPAMGNRYYMMPMLDAWTNVFNSPGTRTTGNDKKEFVIIGPNYKGEIPAELEKIHAPTEMVWIIGRTKTNGVADYKAVNEKQKQYTLTPLTEWRRVVSSISVPKVDPFVDTKTAPVKQVAELEPVEFYRRLAELMKDNPPAAEDAAMVAKLEKIGIIPGKSLRTGAISDEMKSVFGVGARDGWATIKEDAADLKGEKANGWVYAFDLGDYKTHYLKRATVALLGLGANLTADAIYPRATVDSNGEKLHGSNNYVIHFTKAQKPPVKGFWSITMYNQDQFFVKNPINRFAIGDRDKLKYNKDGSLDIYIQTNNPGKAKESNWLPAPQDGFNLIARLYWPEPEAINGTWRMPGVQKVPKKSTNLAGFNDLIIEVQ